MGWYIYPASRRRRVDIKRIVNPNFGWWKDSQSFQIVNLVKMSITFLWKKIFFFISRVALHGFTIKHLTTSERKPTVILVGYWKKTLGTLPHRNNLNFAKKLYEYTLGVPPHPETVPNEGLQGFPTKNGIILVVTVTGKGPHPKYTSSSWCLCHSFEKYVRQIGSSPPRDRGEHSKRMLETYLPPIVINHYFQKMCFIKLSPKTYDDFMK